MDQISNQLSPGRELRRKTIHLATAVLPLLYRYCLTGEQITILLVLLTAAFLTAEICRYVWPRAGKLFARMFFPLLRENEKYHALTGATLYLISATVAVLLFDRTIAVAAVLILSVSDSLAALAGRTWGRHKFFNKSLEGSVTFFLCTMILLFIFMPEMAPVKKALAAGLITLLEAAPLPVPDNLIIPPAAGILLMYLS